MHQFRAENAVDDIDRQLLGLLRDDARTPVSTLARKLRVARGTASDPGRDEDVDSDDVDRQNRLDADPRHAGQRRADAGMIDGAVNGVGFAARA